MITTVTLNPMLDKTVRVQRIVPGKITRADAVASIVGGKGVNVARQLHRFGRPVRATGLWGGEVGDQLDRLLEAEGLLHEFVRIAAMTREGVTYRDAEGIMTSIFEPPHAVTRGEVESLVVRCHAFLAEGGWLVCCGSSPCAECDDVYGALVRDARACSVRTAVDTYGEALRHALRQAPDVVKINREECHSTLGLVLDEERQIIDALLMLVEQGIGLAILTDGPRPCYAASPAGCWKLFPPSVRSVNPTGSGDSMLAGILYGLGRGWNEPTSVCFGVAAGAANAAVWDVSSVSIDDTLRIVPAFTVMEVDVP